MPLRAHLLLACGVACSVVTARAETPAAPAAAAFAARDDTRGPPTVTIARESRDVGASAAAGPSAPDDERAIVDFRQREPGDGTPCSRKTTAWITRDEDHLIVRFVCEEQPGAVRAHLSRRDDILADDRVLVYLDTYGDHRRAYEFSCNPLGVQLDAMIIEGQEDADDTFDAVWSSEGHLTPDGYTVRMSIPLRNLRFANGPDQPWRVALGRVIPRNNEESYWPYITNRLNGLVPQFATLNGLSGASAGWNAQVIPYGISTRARFLDSDAQVPAIERRNEMRGGFDSKLVLHDTYTIDASFQPDFSQVESDEPQVTINKRFEVFFPERRPFFIENANYFLTPATLFFSRRIADPGAGVRFTGRSGSWVMGGVVADDRAPGRALPAGDPRTGEHAWNEVVSLRREFDRESSVGLLATRRSFGGGSNDVLSLDARRKLTPNWVFDSQAMQSFTRKPDGSQHTAPGFVVELTRDGRHVEDLTRYIDFAPGFQSQLGFIKRVDIRQLEEEFKYRWRPEHGPVTKYGPTLSGVHITDQRGDLQEWQAGLGFRVDVSGPTELNVEHDVGVERFEGTDFRKPLTSIEFTSDRVHWLGVDAKYQWGSEINFDPAPGLAPFLAGTREAKLELVLRPSPRLNLAQTWIYSGLHDDGSIFDNVLLRTKLNYQFTRELSLRAIVDHSRVSPDRTRVDLDDERQFGVDLLATYLLSPGTALYVGYADLLENLALDPTTPVTLRRTDVANMSTGRQFFIKASFLFHP